MSNTIETIRDKLVPVVATLTDNFYASQVTVLRATETQDATGQRLRTWVDDEYLVDVRAAIVAGGSPQATGFFKEFRGGQFGALSMAFLKGDYLIALGSYEPSITPEDRFRDQNGRVYEIRGVTADPLPLMSQFICDVVAPGTGDGQDV
jgi:hypothetical protein